MNQSPVHIKNLDKACETLKQGNLVAIPTETVYGLAAPITDVIALKKIFSVKERPFFDPLIVHVLDVQAARPLFNEWSETQDLLANRFWPGPLTLVAPKNKTLVSDTITSGLETVGVRVPDHPLTLALLKQIGIPLAAPSANKFGKTSPSRAEHVMSEFPREISEGKIYVLDGGPCRVGIESSIIKVDEDSTEVRLQFLRRGLLTEMEVLETLKSVKKPVRFVALENRIQAPGQIEHHYMPAIPLVFVAGERIKENLQKIPFQNFSELQLDADPVQAARELYANLRACANQVENQAIVFFCPNQWQKSEEWSGIIDRLWRASSIKIS